MLPFLLVAGIMYHFTTSFTDTHGEVRSSGRVYADGDRYRFDLDPAPGRAREFDVVISNDADRTALLIDTAKKKYHDRVRVTTKTRSSILFQFPFPGGETDGPPAIQHREEGVETIAGHPAKKHVIEVEYHISAEDDDGTQIKATVHAVQTLWCAEDLPRLPFEREMTTGWTAVDRDLKPVTSAITGMTLASDLVVTRTLEGGPAIRETTHTSIDEMKIAHVAPETFVIPKDYVYDEAPMAPKSR